MKWISLIKKNFTSSERRELVKQSDDHIVQKKSEINAIHLDRLKRQLNKIQPEGAQPLVQNTQKLASERFLKDNERIWTVTTIFLPLTLAGLTQLKNQGFGAIILLGLGSIYLINFWYVATEKLREFQEKNLEAVELYDLYLGIDTKALFYKDDNIEQIHDEINRTRKNKPKTVTDLLAGFLTTLRSVRIQEARLYMYYLVTSIWLLVMTNAIILKIFPAESANFKTNLFIKIHDTTLKYFSWRNGNC
ncbi:hypothetical protein [Spirosoma sordidisoli]|uniref:Uncharacterized protein n=1 Tax=Spirosoma sordidisoli TaxID=2502893 RepID=A0A4Q2UQX8_9BACT|nr:hypothetical protein [Spirosoma sordidisoli]RYC70060.1 hypothetical protein EQG79_09320 [Spirosoma sordidisoli]